MNDAEIKLPVSNKIGFEVEALKFSIPGPFSSYA